MSLAGPIDVGAGAKVGSSSVVMPWSSIGARVVLEPRTLVRLAYPDPATPTSCTLLVVNPELRVNHLECGAKGAGLMNQGSGSMVHQASGSSQCFTRSPALCTLHPKPYT